MKENNYVLIVFFAHWCGPCQTLEPIIENIAKLYRKKLKILHINVDNNNRLVKQFSIQTVPTLILYEESREIWRNSGLISNSNLSKYLDKIITVK